MAILHVPCRHELFRAGLQQDSPCNEVMPIILEYYYYYLYLLKFHYWVRIKLMFIVETKVYQHDTALT